MEKRTVKKTREEIEYQIKCPHCGKYIPGSTEGMAEWNMSIHLNAKHKDVLKKKGGNTK